MLWVDSALVQQAALTHTAYAQDMTFSVALIGAGPRGITALQALARTCTSVPLTVHLYGVFDDDGAKVAGYGSAWRPDQPDFVRLNASSGIVDMWRAYRMEHGTGEAAAVEDALPGAKGGPAASPAAATPHTLPNPTTNQPLGPTFYEWACTNAPEWAQEEFPPRAVIGQYFADCYAWISAHLPESITLIEHGYATRVRRAEAADVTASNGAGSSNDGRIANNPAQQHNPVTARPSWLVESAGDDPVVANELLLAVGHAAENPNPLTPAAIGDESGDILVIDSAYPVSRLDAIAPGAQVAVRGAGLSFVDVALALTEGRGGRFVPVDEGEHCDQLRYESGPTAASLIRPIATDGRFQPAKPPHVFAEDHSAAVARAQEGIEQAQDLPEIQVIFLELVAAVARAEGVDGDVSAALTPPEPAPHAGEAELTESVQAAAKPDTVTIEAIAGTLWAAIYAAVVERVSGQEWPAEQWRDFTEFTGSVERFSFGPPPQSAAKIQALIDAGVIDTEWLDTGVDQSEIAALSARGQHVDAVVDAVLAPPGWWAGAYPALAPLDELLGQWASHGRGGARVGVRINDDAAVLDAAGNPVPGLAAIGRITEEWVLGNDTLNQALHEHPRRWAATIAVAAAGGV